MKRFVVEFGWTRFGSDPFRPVLAETFCSGPSDARCSVLFSHSHSRRRFLSVPFGFRWFHSSSSSSHVLSLFVLQNSGSGFWVLQVLIFASQLGSDETEHRVEGSVWSRWVRSFLFLLGSFAVNQFLLLKVVLEVLLSPCGGL